MKKRLSYLLVAWLLCLGNVMADDIIISDVTVPQGGTVDLPIDYNFTSATDKVGFTLGLGLPTGISLVVDGEGDPVYTKSACINKFNIIYTDGNFAAQPSSSTATISGTSGTLLTIQLSADNSLVPGSVLVVNVTKCTIQQKEDGAVTDINIPDFTFNVTVSAPADGRTVLDETSTSVPEASNGTVDVRVKRTIVKNTWSTICLPFDMTEAQVKAAFGSDVKLGDFTGTDDPEYDGEKVIGITANFNSVSAITANHPYIIKMSLDSDISEFTVDGVEITPDEDGAYYEFDNGKTGRQRVVYSGFYGTYHNNTVLDKYTLFLNDNKFWYSTGKTKMKAFRAYFQFCDVLAEVEEGLNARVLLSYEGSNGEKTKIDARTMMAIENGKVYTVAGQYVGEGEDMNRLPKGVYIVNGKKIIK